MFVDFWLPFWTWGYPFALVGLAAALGALLAYDRARAAGGLPLAAAGLGALASWLHPWQGEVLLLILVVSEGVSWSLGHRPRPGSLVALLGAIALPVAYYAVLSRADPSWHQAQLAGSRGYPLWPLLVKLAPLELPALLAYAQRPASYPDVALRVWPLAATAAFVLDEHGLGSGPWHAYLGISIPLAVLAVQGARNIPWPSGAPRAGLAALAVLALTVPAAVDQFTHAARFVLPGPRQANFVGTADARALDYLARQRGSGAVLADFHIGELVPAQTGRRTYVGNPFWSQPGFVERNLLSEFLLLRWLSPAKAQAFVLSTGARYVVDECWSHRSLSRLLAPIIESVHRFGCARVYTVRTVWPRPAAPTIATRLVAYRG